ncbi:hypothetical protein EUTSA_v10009528mg [Eutrema salsugineum]|uniref:Phorbol-ester/DAG-type domain-containing protein n=1 Tax=Eutrema salsugineum TaxID=72664 RepID=V4KWF8_EUTSA|nr:hypothetical protein EUTSA_v10009528mg [Eutrema salsugineum]
MERNYKYFWHPEESNDQHKSSNPSTYSWSAMMKVIYGNPTFCDECRKHISDASGSLSCDFCDKEWHFDCVPSSPDEINHPFHPYHPLKLLIDGPPDYSDGKCVTCQMDLNGFLYHCSICDISMHVRCHKHTLTLMARNDTFTCNACGTHGQRCPYVCAPCGLMFHRDCITLPHVININRHDHRVAHTFSPGFGNWKCMICHKKIDWRYGAYSSQKCPDVFFHSKCATRKDVWDGVELEGVPEDVVDVSPFKVIEDGVINHFSHEEHNLRLIDEDAIDRHKSIRYSNGFRYECGDTILDVRCASMSWYCDYECHPHTLFLTTLDRDTCGACLETEEQVLHCVECEFTLDFKCATLPKKIKHRCDDHFMSLCFGEKVKPRGKYWCEVCETVLDPQKWFYSCGDCGVVCHIPCVLGELWNAKPRVIHYDGEGTLELVPNDSLSRPKCGSCGSHCQQPLIIKFSSLDMEEFFCDTKCFKKYEDYKFGGYPDRYQQRQQAGQQQVPF